MADVSDIFRFACTHNNASFAGGQYSGDAPRFSGPQPMTREEIGRMAETRRDPPSRFTGLWRGRYYYRGREWTGPTNTIGRR